jgi:hypothetical protein
MANSEQAQTLDTGTGAESVPLPVEQKPVEQIARSETQAQIVAQRTRNASAILRAQRKLARERREPVQQPR